MGYRTVDEIPHFDFQNAEITELMMERGHLVFRLGYVTILPENSCNRDIRKMGTSELVLQIQNAEIVRFVQEGYKVYDADGNLKQTCEDREINASEYPKMFEALADGTIYSLCRKEPDSGENGHEYEIYMDGDADGRTYLLSVRGTHDVQVWERFMNREGTY